MTEITPTIIWACIGIGLILIELFTATFFILFFGIAALVVAATKLLNLTTLPADLILFAVIGVSGTLIFRNKMLKSLAVKAELKIDQHKVITMTEGIASKATGCVIYRGSPWKAFNDSETDLKKGDSAVIAKIDGIRLIVVPEQMLNKVS